VRPDTGRDRLGLVAVEDLGAYSPPRTKRGTRGLPLEEPDHIGVWPDQAADQERQ
jgi:hypothetical protein